MESSRAPESFMDCLENMAEMLAVDLEESSDIFQSRQLSAGAPAPGLAGDGTRKRRYSLQHCLSPTFPSQPTSAQPDSKSWETIHEKYSDIFAPLDFNAPKRGSVSSSCSSVDLEPTSVGTRTSVLTIDTCVDSEKAASHAFLQFSPNSDTAQVSWIDLDDALSPTNTQRRRSSMSDFSRYRQQFRLPTEADAISAMSLRSPVLDVTEVPMSPISERTLVYPSGIPQRRSSLKHQGAYAATQQFAQYIDQEESRDDSLHLASPTEPHYDELPLRSRDDIDSPFHNDESNSTISAQNVPTPDYQMYPAPKETMSKKRHSSETGEDPIASSQVGFEEWLESDIDPSTRGDQPFPRPLAPNIQETIKFFIANFPETMLMCNSLVVEKIRGLSHRVRYNADRPTPDFSAAPVQQHHKLPKWKWLGSSTQHQDQPNPEPMPTHNRPEWAVMQKVFPHGNKDLCEALYAYVLVYNYVTSLCIRFPVFTVDLSRPATPWTAARPSTSRSTNGPDPGYGPATLQPSLCETSTVPRKAASVLGLAEDDILIAPPPIGLPRPSSRASLRGATFTNFRAVPSFFNGTGQPKQRSDGTNSPTTRPTTPALAQSSLSRPMTPTAGGPGAMPMTPTGTRGADLGRQLADLRYGLARCCARLTVTLHRANPSITKRKADKDYKVDPSFMRSLCEIVRATEDTIGRCH